jgi:hypothetical protein
VVTLVVFASHCDHCITAGILTVAWSKQLPELCYCSEVTSELVYTLDINAYRSVTGNLHQHHFATRSERKSCCRIVGSVSNSCNYQCASFSTRSSHTFQYSFVDVVFRDQTVTNCSIFFKWLFTLPLVVVAVLLSRFMFVIA